MFHNIEKNNFFYEKEMSLLQLLHEKWRLKYEIKDQWNKIVNTPCLLDLFIFENLGVKESNRFHKIKEALLFLIDYIQYDEPPCGCQDLALQLQIRRINYTFSLILNSLDKYLCKNIVKQINSVEFITSEYGMEPSEETCKLKDEFGTFLNKNYPNVNTTKLYQSIPVDPRQIMIENVDRMLARFKEPKVQTVNL